MLLKRRICISIGAVAPRNVLHHHEQCMCVYLGALLGPLFNAKLNFASSFLLSVYGQTAKFKDRQYFRLYGISSSLNLREVAANKHTHVQCSLGSVGLTQAHHNENTLHEYNFTTIIHLTTTHQHFPNCCCPYIFVVASNSAQQAISLSPAISSARSAISSINAHPQLVKLFRSIWFVRKRFYANIF